MKKAKKTPRRPRAQKSRKKNGLTSPAELLGEAVRHNLGEAFRLFQAGRPAKADQSR